MTTTHKDKILVFQNKITNLYLAVRREPGSTSYFWTYDVNEAMQSNVWDENHAIFQNIEKADPAKYFDPMRSDEIKDCKLVMFEKESTIIYKQISGIVANEGSKPPVASN